MYIDLFLSMEMKAHGFDTKDQKEKNMFKKELEELSDMTLELIESTMEQMDLDDEMMDDSFLWGGGNLGQDDKDVEKSYEEWLKHYGIADDEENN